MKAIRVYISSPFSLLVLDGMDRKGKENSVLYFYNIHHAWHFDAHPGVQRF